MKLRLLAFAEDQAHDCEEILARLGASIKFVGMCMSYVKLPKILCLCLES
jgi:hypothetical protein